MGKINSRSKGAAFEREVAKHINNFFEEIDFDYKVKRNLEQYQEKDLGDLEIPHHSIECKRYAKGNWYKEDWWQQVCESSGPNKIPVLIWKYNRQPIRVCMPLWAIDYNDTRTDLSYCKGDNTITMVMTLDNWLHHVLAYNL